MNGRKKSGYRFSVFDCVNETVLILVSLICVYPFLYVFFVACSDGIPLAMGKVTFLPKGFQMLSFKLNQSPGW